MSDLLISSKQNSIVKYVRGLREKRIRDKEGYFVIEGVKSVYEAFLSGIRPDRLILSERGKRHPLTKEIMSRFGDSVPITAVTDDVMDFASETDTPQGIMAVVSIPQTGLAGLAVDESSVFVVIDGVQDPGNVGTIIRTADAFGAKAVILTRGSADIYNSKTLRSTMGSVFHIPVIRDISAQDLNFFFKEKAIFTAATTLDKNSECLHDVSFEKPLALIFGSESKGISPEIIGNADAMVKIPMGGFAESLNVAVAAGIVLYEASWRHGSKASQTCK